MPRKVRKQIYIGPHQERWLKRRARQKGVTEAEIIRQGLEDQMRQAQVALERARVWAEERAFIKKWIKKGPVAGGRTWWREDLYER